MKFMTLNTHSLSESDEKNKLQTIANFILNHDVDVICLQEVNQSMTAKSVGSGLNNVNYLNIIKRNHVLATVRTRLHLASGWSNDHSGA